MLVLAPAHLRADFQQFYHLNLDDMGERYSLLHAADCAAMLPYQARIWGQLEQFKKQQEIEEQRKRDGKFALPVDEYKRLLKQGWEDD